MLISPIDWPGQPVRQYAAVPFWQPPPPLIPPPLAGGSAFFLIQVKSASPWLSHPVGFASPSASHAQVLAALAHWTNALPSVVHAEGMIDGTFAQPASQVLGSSFAHFATAIFAQTSLHVAASMRTGLAPVGVEVPDAPAGVVVVELQALAPKRLSQVNAPTASVGSRRGLGRSAWNRVFMVNGTIAEAIGGTSQHEVSA